MAKISFTKKTQTTNKRKVQDAIYNWVGETVNGFNSILLLAGKHPLECVKRAVPLMNKWGTIYLYEKDTQLYSFVKQHYMEQLVSVLEYPSQKISLVHSDIRSASKHITFQDLDFCATFYSTRKRAVQNYKNFDDPINIIQDRLFHQSRSSTIWKVMTVSVSPRNGIGKRHSIECINSLCHQLGWTISFVDRRKRPHFDGYGEGTALPGRGTIHNNGGEYHAYEHRVTIERLPSNLDQVKDLSLRFFTYTDTQPMITFSLLYK